ncbi:hypothetical protein FMN50_01735 [Rhodobacterales bacterium]|nr:hypothetical protein FMN50_01735 [Rhodobacterales bacterium]
MVVSSLAVASDQDGVSSATQSTYELAVIPAPSSDDERLSNFAVLRLNEAGSHSIRLTSPEFEPALLVFRGSDLVGFSVPAQGERHVELEIFLSSEAVASGGGVVLTAVAASLGPSTGGKAVLSVSPAADVLGVESSFGGNFLDRFLQVAQGNVSRVTGFDRSFALHEVSEPFRKPDLVNAASPKETPPVRDIPRAHPDYSKPPSHQNSSSWLDIFSNKFQNSHDYSVDDEVADIPAPPMRAPAAAPENSMATDVPQTHPTAAPSVDVTADVVPRPAANWRDVFLPAFKPWPPPKPTTLQRIPRALYRPFLDSETATYGDVSDLIEKALFLGGYDRFAYFGVPGGFALVTQLEQIQANGLPVEPSGARWNAAIAGSSSFDLATYIHRLFFARKGYYRVLVFTVLGTPLIPGGDVLETDPDWIGEGATGLPRVLRAERFGEEHDINVLIYEFERHETETAPRFRKDNESPLSASDHLNGARFTSFFEEAPDD